MELSNHAGPHGHLPVPARDTKDILTLRMLRSSERHQNPLRESPSVLAGAVGAWTSAEAETKPRGEGGPRGTDTQGATPLTGRRAGSPQPPTPHVLGRTRSRCTVAGRGGQQSLRLLLGSSQLAVLEEAPAQRRAISSRR